MLSIYTGFFWPVHLFAQGLRPLPVICGGHCVFFPLPRSPPLPLSTAQLELWSHTSQGKAGKGVTRAIGYCHAKQGYAWSLNIPLPLRGKSCTTTSPLWLSLGPSAGENVTFQDDKQGTYIGAWHCSPRWSNFPEGNDGLYWSATTWTRSTEPRNDEKSWTWKQLQ